MRIGIMGIGNMGRAIVDRLVEQGQSPVGVWNRTAAKAAGIDGTEQADTPAALAAASDIVLSLLANDAAIEAAYFGQGGLCSAPLNGTVIVEMCTTSPERTQALEAAVTAKGGLFLECPVGGTIGPARSGSLLGLAGGTPEAFAAAEPALALITRRLEHLGPVGHGAAMKLAINLPLMVYWGAVGEALGLAIGQGVDSEMAVSILVDSSGAIGAAKTRLPPVAKMRETGDPGGVSLSLANGVKDMKLMEALAARHGVSSEVITAARTKAEVAANEGWTGYDTSLYGIYGQGEDN
ncbi:NAD(P)-dependent oxidoreductase [Flavimaricola marinus]|uniref:2-(Hydroxymethyl)glutarate dehydrogenase n=1 Tax=Flavimaricola marinus TaxID=1819565 RepID=A0A238LEA3_9RHOB|nr:NAD(P)-dependent oxidoreductase [Flavimaricola marinus]SMY08037.1 2-(hydroxymethyl)glutarate dehydrogenase [Flavimaricola marinus]